MAHEPYRVLQVVGGLDAGGIESLIMGLYRHIDREKFQFDFVKHTTNIGVYEEEALSLGAKVYIAPRYKGLNHCSYKIWWRSLFNDNSDCAVVHGHMRSTASIYLCQAKRNGRAAIAHAHNTSDGSGAQALVKRLLYRNIPRWSDVLLACSDEAAKWQFGKHASATIFPNAIDTLRFSFDFRKRDEVRKRLGIADSALLIGNVSRFSEAKNQIWLIDMFSELLRVRQNAKLLLVGDGPLRPEAEKRTRILNLDDKVIFVGSTSDPSSYYSAMDIFVFPSLFEGFGNVLLEAQCSGLPCLASDVVPRVTAVTPLVKYLSLSAEKGAWIQELLSMSSDLSTRTDAREAVVKAGFDIRDAASLLERLYSSLLEKRAVERVGH